jgi:uncharacterized protein YcfJ
MNVTLKHAIGLGALACAAQVAAQVTFYEHEGFQGRSFTADRPVGNFDRYGFNDRASSVIVRSERWEVCEDVRFSGRCVVLRRGEYPTLAAMGLNDRVSSVRNVGRGAPVPDDRYAPAPMTPEVRFFEREGFGGRSFVTDRTVWNFDRYGFNDRASSAIVVGTAWEVCEDARFSGRCVVLRPGHYPSLASMGLNNSVSSVRALERAARVDDSRYAPAPLPVYDARRRPGEQLYSARVTDVRAVVGASGQRCWVERQEVPAERGSANVPGAIAGAVIGGILGHQVGGGSGRDVATVGGVVAGAAIGANVGRADRPAELRDVQRCTSVPGQARPDYWDVSYDFRGTEHHVQMATPPGPTITVNERGEPRG